MYPEEEVLTRNCAWTIRRRAILDSDWWIRQSGEWSGGTFSSHTASHISLVNLLLQGTAGTKTVAEAPGVSSQLMRKGGTPSEMLLSPTCPQSSLRNRWQKSGRERNVSLQLSAPQWAGATVVCRPGRHNHWLVKAERNIYCGFLYGAVWKMHLYSAPFIIRLYFIIQLYYAKP